MRFVKLLREGRGVWGVLHGEAGEVCARAIGEYGMTPTDVIAALPAVIEEHVS